MAMKAKEMGKPGKVCEISFRPAKGGAVSETRTEYQRGGQGGGPDVDYEHETAVHPTMAHAVNHLKNHLAEAFPQGDRSSVEPDVADAAGSEE